MTVFAVIIAFAFSACSSDPPTERREGYGVIVDEAGTSAELSKDSLSVAFRLTSQPGADPTSGSLEVTLHTLDHQNLGSAQGSFSVAQGKPATVALTLPRPNIAKAAELGGYLLTYEARISGDKLHGAVSAYRALRHAQLVVTGSDRYVAGHPSVLRVRVEQRGSGSGIAGRDVSVRFNPSTGTARTLASGKTNDRGELPVQLSFGADDLGTGQLVVEAGGHSKSFPILIERPRRVLVTLDKPLYQPGQAVHIRAVALDQPGMKPVAGEKTLIEVLDPDGNKLMKKETATDKHGIVSTRFELARLLGLGTYTVRLTLGDVGDDGGKAVAREKTFKVARYTLPKFKVTVAPEKSWVLPGESVKGEVQARYFFGKAVAGASVKLVAKIADTGKLVADLNGKTDGEGRFPFEIKTTYAGQLSLVATVDDAGGASHDGSAAVKVTAERVVVQVVPERGTVVVNHGQRFFVMVTDPSGKPLSGTVYLTGALSAKVDVPSSGLASFTAIASYCGEVRAELAGANSTATRLPCDGSNASPLVLTTDKALYREGESAKLSISAPASLSEVTLEVLRQNVVVATQRVALSSGKGSAEVSLGAKLRRTLTVRVIGHVGGKSFSDQRLIHVAGDDQLTVKVAADKTSYRPGGKAKVTLSVTDQKGRPAPAALGVYVVDEALFALSEIKPGLERRFFLLEQGVIDAGKALRFVGADVLLAAKPTAADQIKARMLFAAAHNRQAYPINFRSSSDLSSAVNYSRLTFDKMMRELKTQVRKRFQVDTSLPWISEPKFSDEDVLSYVKGWLAKRADAWGRAMTATLSYGTITVTSSGMDERRGNNDDLSGYVYVPRGGYYGGGHADGGAASMDSGGGGWFADAASADAGAPPPSGDGGGGSTPSATPVRQKFPETLHVDPKVITDGNGKAQVDLALADSITSWRLTAIAHSLGGKLGSTSSKLTVFQEFFLDVMLPENLTQGDEVTVPVAVYNYLSQPKTVTVSITQQSWFSVVGPTTQQVTLAPRSVSSVKFRVRALKVGTFGLTASGKSSSESDALRRTVRVRPDGRRQTTVFSGTLAPGKVSHTVTIPAGAIDGASELFVKVFPGIIAELVEGLDSMLREPHGCFEQTSSSTYPNVLVLRYLAQAKLSSPAVETKAKGYIGSGYQRLLTYEVPGGGFSLWGKPPANIALSAFGLMEFSDMAAVRFVDPALIKRTQAWLLQQQLSSGAFPAPKMSSYENTAVSTSKSELRTTAYVAWALAESGYRGPALDRALSYLRNNVGQLDDDYGRALAANALLVVSRTDAAGLKLLAALKQSAKTDAKGTYWQAKGQSMTWGYGDSMKIETTALAAAALLAGGDGSTITGKALKFLAASRGSYGGWGTTQATVLTLRVLLASLKSKSGGAAAGTVVITHDGTQQATAEITQATNDVTRYFDLKQVVHKGDNKVEVTFTGSGELAYQVVGVHYVPHSSTPPKTLPFDFAVSYDNTQLRVGDTLTVTATLSRTDGGSVPNAMMLIGVPPGFTVDQQAIKASKLQNTEIKNGKLVLYLGDITGTETVTIPMRATMSVRARAAASTAYPYYSPELIRVVQTPIVTVTEPL